MRVLLVSPHLPYRPGSYLAHPSLGFGMLATALKRHGHEVAHADLPFEGNTLERLSSWLDTYRPDLVGLTCVAQSYRQALDAATRVKAHHARLPVVMGGPHTSFIAAEVLGRHPAVDYVLSFDAEDSLVALAQAVEATPAGPAEAELAQIPGLTFRAGERVVTVPPSPPDMELDRYGHPDRSIFDMGAYLRNDYETVVVTSRGCPSRCTFCSTAAAGRRYRFHSVEYAMAEVREIARLGFTSIYFGDDTIGGDRQRLLAFCDAMIKADLGVEWTSNIRALDVEPEAMRRMKAAGAYRVFIGFESVSSQSLKMMAKRARLDAALAAARVVTEAGLELHASFIVGAPGDTPATVRDTLDFIRELNPTIATFNPFEPRPGTPMYDRADAFGVIIPDRYWYESTGWLSEPVAYTSTMTKEEISAALVDCYSLFCSPSFSDDAHGGRLIA
jgi:radical SAM superfamily enzyme YgiQ (UPF0313 family)